MYPNNSSLGCLGCYLVPLMCLSHLCPSLSIPPVRSVSSLCLSRYLFLHSRLCVSLSRLSPSLAPCSVSHSVSSLDLPLGLFLSLALCPSVAWVLSVCVSVCVFLIHPALVCQSLVLCVFHVHLCSLLWFVCPCVYLCPCRRL